MKVDIILVGGQKCGTTALHTFLSKHPKIIACQPKEPDFFCSDSKFFKGVNYYHSFFKKKLFFSGIRGFHYLDASPSYFGKMVYETTAMRIFEYNPNTKIICLIRNPIDRAYSAWNMYRTRYLQGQKDWWVKWYLDRIGELPVGLIRRSDAEYSNFETYMENELKAIESGVLIECPTLENGNYIFMLEKYKSIFKENCIILSKEEMENDSVSFLNKLSLKLDLPPYSWKETFGIKIFPGEYENTISSKAVSLLKEYYYISNKAIAEKFSISYL